MPFRAGPPQPTTKGDTYRRRYMSPEGPGAIPGLFRARPFIPEA